jgi:cell division protein FtsB
MTSPATTPAAPLRFKGGHKLLVGLALLLGGALLLGVFFSHRGLYQIYRFRAEKLRLDQENARLTAENARLARTIDRLQHDPELIQDLIRRDLNFIKKNEIILQLPPAGLTKGQVLLPSAAAAPAGAPRDGASDKTP